MSAAGRVSVLVRRWWVIPLAALIAGLVALLVTANVPKTYAASAVVLIEPNGALSSAPDVVNSIYPLEHSRIVPTYANIAGSQSTLSAATRAAGISNGIASGYSATAKLYPEALNIQVTVEGPRPNDATRVLTQVLSSASRRFTQAYRVYTVSILDAPKASAAPVRPQPARNVTVALVLGSLAGAGLLLMSPELSLLRRGQRPQQRLATSPSLQVPEHGAAPRATSPEPRDQAPVSTTADPSRSRTPWRLDDH